MTAYKIRCFFFESLAAGLSLGTVMFISFASYALAVWFGAKMILEKSYTGDTVLNVLIAVLTDSMSLGQASPCMGAFADGQAAVFKMFGTIHRKPEIDAYDTKGKILENIQEKTEYRYRYMEIQFKVGYGMKTHLQSSLNASQRHGWFRCFRLSCHVG